MKKLIYLFAFIIAISTNSLQAKTFFSDTLKYKYQTFEKHSKNCVKIDSICAVFKVKYPVFENAEFNATIQKEMLKIFQENNQDVQKLKSLEEASKVFLGEYDQGINEQLKDGTELNSIPWTMETTTQVAKQKGKYIMISIFTDWFTGGAHPVGMNYNLAYEAQTLKRIALKDIFKQGYEPRLLKMAETIFRKQESLKLSDKLDESNGYFFENGKFKLNDNFIITDKSIDFFYNVYEIKPYAAGPTLLSIPLSLIKPLLK